MESTFSSSHKLSTGVWWENITRNLNSKVNVTKNTDYKQPKSLRIKKWQVGGPISEHPLSIYLFTKYWLWAQFTWDNCEPGCRRTDYLFWTTAYSLPLTPPFFPPPPWSYRRHKAVCLKFLGKISVSSWNLCSLSLKENDVFVISSLKVA